MSSLSETGIDPTLISFNIIVRVYRGVGGKTFQAHSNSSILERLWSKVTVEPLSKSELVQVSY